MVEVGEQWEQQRVAVAVLACILHLTSVVFFEVLGIPTHSTISKNSLFIAFYILVLEVLVPL